MNLSDDIIISDSQNLSDEKPADGDTYQHEEEGLSLSAFEEEGISIIKQAEHPVIEMSSDHSEEIMTKNGVEIVACTLEDIDCK